MPRPCSDAPASMSPVSPWFLLVAILLAVKACYRHLVFHWFTPLPMFFMFSCRPIRLFLNRSRLILYKVHKLKFEKRYCIFLFEYFFVEKFEWSCMLVPPPYRSPNCNSDIMKQEGVRDGLWLKHTRQEFYGSLGGKAAYPRYWVLNTSFYVEGRALCEKKKKIFFF